MIAPVFRRRVAFAGGGTGGHLFPGLALARALPSVEPLFIVPSDRGDLERLRGEFPAVVLDVPRVDRSRWLYPGRLVGAMRRAKRMLQEHKVSAVVGLGGYACVPVCLAARRLGLPYYLIEANARAGRATRWLSRRASGVGLSFSAARDGLAKRAECRLVGTPLREEIRRDADPGEFALFADRPTLLVIGGSQGSAGLNGRVLEALAACGDLHFQVLHLAGARDAARVRAAYRDLSVPGRVLEFLQDIGRAYAAADLVLARAGAATVAECAALGRPAIFVPYPHHRDGHQRHNAQPAVAAGAARLVEEAALTPERFRALIQELLLNEEARGAMAAAATAHAQPAAAEEMAAHVLETLGTALSEEEWFVELGG